MEIDPNLVTDEYKRLVGDLLLQIARANVEQRLLAEENARLKAEQERI